MADGGDMVDTGKGDHHNTSQDTAHLRVPVKTKEIPPADEEAIQSPLTPHIPNPFSRQHSALDLDDYFTGPRDILKHSKWPLFLQMHGSILPKMILPLFLLGGWATCITCVSTFTGVSLGISSTLLTVTGFVVGLALSFRSSTAYERYNEGRKSWCQLMLTCNCLGRVYWLHCSTREEHRERDLLAKLSAMNLLTAFAVALKHRLRHEPYTSYEDINNLVGHIDTFAATATRADPGLTEIRKQGTLKTVGSFLGLSFAASNPRKAIKRARNPLGNLPLEILTYLASFTDEIIANGQLAYPLQHTMAYNNITALNDILAQTERVLTTPVPIAYAIAINQITWLYVCLLPFQLFPVLKWVTIPATVAAGYIILGLLFIGREIENPFGNDVNDLPLDSYCAQIAEELDIIASRPKPSNADWIESMQNKVLWPLSTSGWNVWMHRGESKLYEALKAKSEMSKANSDDSD